MDSKSNSDAINYIRSTKAIRDRCGILFALGMQNQLEFFKLNIEKLPACVDYVAKVIRDEYPSLEIPYHSRWRHFDVGGVERAEAMFKTANLPPRDEARARYDLAVTSVLLDAGAGPAWKYMESSTGKTYSRSEGLAVASFDLFAAGKFSSVAKQPAQADADGLKKFAARDLETGFQVTNENPLVGVQGRVELLQRLGKALTQRPEIFGAQNQRIGNMVDYIIEKSSSSKEISALFVLDVVLKGLGPIWPGRTEIDGVNLGDVWNHPGLEKETIAPGLIPFHKLSQWLTYSLLEPLEKLGYKLTDLNQMTGLPEYRNGGLFLDFGILSLKDPGIAKQALKPSHTAIVEWRALTVVLLDMMATQMQKKLGLTPEQFPLAKLLQGGTWTAGRRIAAEKRSGGTPPLQVDSDGTVF